MKKEQLENLLGASLSALVNECGGSLEEALDLMRIREPKLRQEIKVWFGWDNE